MNDKTGLIHRRTRVKILNVSIPLARPDYQRAIALSDLSVNLYFSGKPEIHVLTGSLTSLLHFMFDAILKNISRSIELSALEKDEFCSLLSIRYIRKKEFLVQPGEICSHESYINKGCFRNYIIDQEGLERNFYFSIEDWWVSDIYSRTFNVPAFCHVIAVEDSEIVQIPQSELEKLMIRIPKLEHFFRIAYQKSMAIHQFQLLQRLHMSAEEQYMAFRTKYPGFDKRIPQKHIATYLGFTPEFFNTIRTKVLKQL